MTPNPFDEFQPAKPTSEWDEFAPAGPSTKQVLKAVASTNPDDAAEVARLAKRYPAPNEVLLRNLKDVRLQAAVDEADRKLGGSPKLAEMLRQSPFITQQTHDDIDPLVSIEKVTAARADRTAMGTLGDVGVVALKGAVGLPQAFVGLANIVSGGYAGKGLEAVGLRFADAQQFLDTLYSPAQQQANEAVREAEGFIDTLGAMLANPSTIATTVGESAPQMLGGAAIGRGLLAAAPKLAPWLAAAFGEGLMGAGATAEQLRAEDEEGLLSAKATLASLGSGAGTTLFGAVGGRAAQKLGLGDIDTALTARGLDDATAKTLQRGFVARITAAGISEGLFEELPQSVQEQMWQNWATDKPLGQGVGKAAAQGLLAGLSMGGGFQAVSEAGATLQRTLLEREAATARAEAESQRLADALKAAAASKLRERNPETFQQLVAGMSDNTTVFIDAQVLMQSATPEQIAQMLPSTADQLDAAVAANGMVEVPISEALTALPGTPLEQVFVQNARATPTALSLADAQQAGEQAQEFLKAEAERVLTEAQDRDAWQAEVETVKQTVLADLNTAARFTPEVNESYAMLQAQFFSTMASRYGMTPAQLYDRYKVRVAANSTGGQVLNAGGKPGEITVEGYHYSNAARPVISTRFYGTGLRGSGRDLYLNADDKRLRNRAYFYVDKGTGINPESGVGGVAQRANLTNIYDSDADPLGLKKGANQLAFESAVLDAGFAGYLARMDGTQSGQAILLGDQAVQAEVLGPMGRIEAGQRVEALPRQAPQWKTQASGDPAQLQARMERMQSNPAWANYDMRIEGRELQVREKDGVFNQSFDAQAGQLAADIEAAGGKVNDLLQVDQLIASSEIPTITLQDLVGLDIFPTIADRTAAAAVYSGIDSSRLDVAIPLLGGPFFPLRESNVEAGVVWANRGRGVTSQKAAKLKAGANYMMVLLGDADMHQSNSTVAAAVMGTLEAWQRDGRMSAEQVDALGDLVRTAPSADPAVKDYLEGFPGFDDAAIMHAYMDGMSFNARKRVIEILASKEALALGAPPMNLILDATREPSLAGHRWGDGVILLEVDQVNTQVELGTEGTTAHPDFPVGIRGRVVGKLNAAVNWELLWQDWLKANTGASPRRAFELAKPVVSVTQELVDRIGPIEQTNIDSPRQARLAADFAAGNWRQTGVPVKQGGASPQEFVDAILTTTARPVLTEYTLDQVKQGAKDGSFKVFQLGADGKIFFGLKYGDPGYAADYGIEIPEIGANEVALVSVVNNEQGARGIGAPAVVLKALQEGATVLDCFAVKSEKYPDGFLPELYAAFGFEKVAEVPFAPEYYSEQKLADAVKFWKDSTPGYDPATSGYPPLVIMKWKGTDADRTDIVERYLRDGIAGVLARGASADVQAAEAGLAAPTGAEDATQGRAADTQRDPGGQGNRAGARIASRARSTVQGIADLTDNELANLALTPDDRAAVRRALGRPDTGVLNQDAPTAADPVGGMQGALEQGPRGTFNPQTLLITLNESANLSTFLHESGHFFLEVLADLASQPNAPQQIQDDMAQVLKWFGIEGAGQRDTPVDLVAPIRSVLPDRVFTPEEVAAIDAAARSERSDGRAARSAKESLASFADVTPTQMSQIVTAVRNAQAQRTPLETWRAMTLDQKRPYHERFAESFEQYLLEGKAPSTELQPLFRKFRSWLLQVYKSLKAFAQGRDLQVSDDIRRVFDRMLATDEQIAEAEKVAGMLPDFDATNEAIERLQTRSLRDMKWLAGARTKAIKALQKQAATLRKAVEAEVREEVDAMPEFRAQRALADVRKQARRQPNDTEMAVIADANGYASAEEMLAAIDAVGKKADVIEGMTDQRMLERHGDLVDQRAIEEAANAAVHNEARARMLATELKTQSEALNPRQQTGTASNGRAITVNALQAAARQFAADLTARRKLKDLKNAAWQHTAAERRAAKRWQEATAKGQTAEAVQAKRDQLLNNYTAKAMTEALAEVKKIEEFFAKVTKGNDEKIVKGGRDPDVVNAMRAMLAAYGIAPRLEKQALEYMEAVRTNDPAMYAALQPGVQAATLAAKPFGELTLEELRGLNEELRAMWLLAKRSRQMEVDGNLLDREELEAELQARMQDIGVPEELGAMGAPTNAELARRALQFAGSWLRRAEQWAEGMDGRYGGPFLRYVFLPVKEAADRYRSARLVYRKKYQALVDAVAPHLTNGTIKAPELGGYEFGRGTKSIGHAELLHAILHTGNDSNKRKLLLGRKWATENADGTLDTSKWDAFIDRMHTEGKLTKAHYDFAQGVWDLLEETKPLAQKTHREVYGRYFDEVTANEVVTPFGAYRGGYVPAQVDTRIVTDNEIRKLAEAENESMSYSFPAANKGFTNARVEYNRPLLLDLRTLGQHIDKVLLFSHVQSPINDVNRLLTSKGVSYSLSRIDPSIYAGMLTPWLKRSATQVVETPVLGDGGMSRVLTAARNRSGMSLMFANAINAIQQTTGFINAFSKLKSDGLQSHMMRATAEFLRSPKTMANAVADASPFMATRMENEIAAINDAMDAILLDPSLYEKAQAWSQKHAYFLQTALANTMEPIIWTAGFNAAIEKGMSDKDAMRYADGLIRQTQGSTLPEDVSRIETGGPFYRMFMQFAGYFNMMGNTNATGLKQVAQEMGLKKGAGKALGIVTLGMLAPLWVAEAIGIAMRGGPDDEDDDGYLDDWIASVLGMGTIKGVFAMVPFVGQFANAGLNRFNDNPADDRVSLSPAVSLLEGAVGVPVLVYKAMTDPDKINARNAVRDVASAVSLATGLPAIAVARPLGYLAGIADDRIEPTGPVDMARGLVTGTASPESKQ